MRFRSRTTIMMTLLHSVLSIEHVNHEPKEQHELDDRTHSAAFDQEAILGSGLKEELAELPPEEAMISLQKIIKQHDTDNDNQISRTEMNRWISNFFRNLDHAEVMEKFKEEDEDKNGQVSWREYLMKVFGFIEEDVEDMHKTVSMSKGRSDEIQEVERSLKIIVEDLQLFRGADTDADDSLNLEEYLAFLFPHNYEHMHKFELDRYLSHNDIDGDGRISRSEFIPESAADEETRISWKEHFLDLDKDKNGILSLEELKEWVVPASQDLAEDETNRLFALVDADGNSQLTSEEILHIDHFVRSTATNYGNVLPHEEL